MATLRRVLAYTDVGGSSVLVALKDSDILVGLAKIQLNNLRSYVKGCDILLHRHSRISI